MDHYFRQMQKCMFWHQNVVKHVLKSKLGIFAAKNVKRTIDKVEGVRLFRQQQCHANYFSQKLSFPTTSCQFNHIHVLKGIANLHHIDGHELQPIDDQQKDQNFVAKFFAAATRRVNWRTFVGKFSANSSPESFQYFLQLSTQLLATLIKSLCRNNGIFHPVRVAPASRKGAHWKSSKILISKYPWNCC